MDIKAKKQIDAMFMDSGWSPKSLSILGNIYDEDRFAVCIVGSRQISEYGKRACQKIAGELAAAGVTIVSGLMYGVDIWAHKSAIEAGGRTIAVLGYGIDHLSRCRYAKEVADEILTKDRGFILTEYKNEQLPTGWTFPKRNKIVAAISKCAVVIEAGIQSGSLITVGHILEFGKDVYVVPGRIFEENSAGSNNLIKQGAFLLDDPKAILERHFPHLYPSKYENRSIKKEFSLSEVEIKILDFINKSTNPVTIDELISAQIVNIAEVPKLVTNLEILALLKRDFTGRLSLLK